MHELWFLIKGKITIPPALLLSGASVSLDLFARGSSLALHGLKRGWPSLSWGFEVGCGFPGRNFFQGQQPDS
jgi:hypothetical protein